jgi:hypothetical protein
MINRTFWIAAFSLFVFLTNEWAQWCRWCVHQMSVDEAEFLW